MVVEFSDHEFITSQFGIVVVVLSKRERGERGERGEGRGEKVSNAHSMVKELLQIRYFI